MTTSTAKPLVQTKFAEASQTTQFTASAGTRVIVDKCTATNTSGATATIAWNVVPSGGTAGASNLIIPPKAITNGSEPDLCPGMVGRILGPGDSISTLASVGSAIVIRVEGREIA